MYRRWSGTKVLNGPSRKLPAVRSNSAPKTLGESGRGKLSHSIEPSGATRQLFSQSDKNP
jgi:hypothetical protein